MEEKGNQEINPQPRKKRKVSLFKRRKKVDLRPFVKEKKTKQFKKYFFIFLIITASIFALSAFLYSFRFIVIPKIFEKKFDIVNPQGRMIPSDSQARSVITKSGLSVSSLTISSDSEMITFVLNSKTQIIMSKYKDLNIQLELIRAIDRKILSDGKQAISIDLRYNKPIVKF